MATGDNALTAICVGRKCTLVNPMLDIFLGELTNDGKLIWSLIEKNEHEEENLTKSEYRAFKYRQTGGSFDNNPIEAHGYFGMPWDYKTKNFEVALTGEAFKYI